MAAKINVDLAKTCRRYYESCLWSSTVHYAVLARLESIKRWATIVPIVIGTSPGATTVAKLLFSQAPTWFDIAISVLSFVSGMTPYIYNALKLDDQIEVSRKLSAEYINLRDRFRTAAEVSIHKSFKEFEADVRPLVEQLEKVRESGIATPQWAYDKASAKIEAGHYSFDVDQPSEDVQATLQVDTDSIPNPVDPPPTA